MFVTLFDKGYLTRGLVMLESLTHYVATTEVIVLTLDFESEIAIRNAEFLQGVNVVRPVDLGLDMLRNLRANRTYREYCWTLASVMCDYLLNKQVKEVVYLDADICFFADPRPVLEQSRSGDVAAIGHRFPQRLKSYEVNGVYNVQWVYFAGSPIGKTAAKKWSEQCKLDCSYAPDRGVIGYQKYLDEWPDLYPTFREISIRGCGVAPWNHEVLNIQKHGNCWMVGEGEELIFYHFHGLKIGKDGGIQMAAPMYERIKPLPIDLYQDYVSRLARFSEKFSNLVDDPPTKIWRVKKTPSLLSRLSTFVVVRSR